MKIETKCLYFIFVFSTHNSFREIEKPGVHLEMQLIPHSFSGSIQFQKILKSAKIRVSIIILRTIDFLR